MKIYHMSFEIEGRLYKIFDTESKTNTFQAREFILEINESNYLQHIKFQLTQDRCQILDAYQEGEEVKVHFDLRGREWNGKFFTNLNAWKLEKPAEGTSFEQDELKDTSFPPEEQEPVFDDDLPF